MRRAPTTRPPAAAAINNGCVARGQESLSVDHRSQCFEFGCGVDINVFFGGCVAGDEMDVAFDQTRHHKAVAVIDDRVCARERRCRVRVAGKYDQAVIANDNGLIGWRGVVQARKQPPAAKVLSHLFHWFRAMLGRASGIAQG